MTDRNIRKVRNAMLKKIRKKLLAALTEKVQAQQPLTLLGKEFLIENGADIEKYTKKQYKYNCELYRLQYIAEGFGDKKPV